MLADLTVAEEEVDAVAETTDRPRPAPLPQRVAVAVAIAAYPVTLMAPVLDPTRHARLAELGSSRLKVTDLDGAILFARAISTMRWPWSHATLVNFPSGESIWRWQSFTQLIQVLVMWLLTRVLPAATTIGVIVFAGWVCTGWAVYVLARRLGAGVATACVAAVMAEMLPSTAVMAANWTSYVWVAVPIWVVIAVIDVGRRPSPRTFFRLYAAAVFTAFFDGYWMYFSAATIVVGLALNADTIWRTQRDAGRYRLVVFLPGVGIVGVGLGALFAARSVGAVGLSRGLDVTSPGLVTAGLRSTGDWITGGPDGVGPVVAVLAAAFVVVELWRRTDRARLTAIAIAVVMVVIATRLTRGPEWLQSHPVAGWARVVMPGVRFFQRAGLVAEPMLCIFAALAVAAVVKRLHDGGYRSWVVVAVPTVFAAATVVTFWPVGHRPVADRWDDFAVIRSELRAVDHPVVLALPEERLGRVWMELWMLDGVPLYNPLYDGHPDGAVDSAALEGPAALAAELEALGITHVLVTSLGLGSTYTEALADPDRFRLTSSVAIYGYEAVDDVARLLEVHPRPGDRCEDCPPVEGS